MRACLNGTFFPDVIASSQKILFISVYGSFSNSVLTLFDRLPGECIFALLTMKDLELYFPERFRNYERRDLYLPGT